MHGIVYMYAKAAESANKNLILLFVFSPVAFSISNRFQINENKFLTKFIIYYLLVGVMRFELWSNEFTVGLQLLFMHTVYADDTIILSEALQKALNSLHKYCNCNVESLS